MDHIDPVIVDGLTITGAYALDGHPIIADIEKRFLLQHVIYEENQEGVIHHRWTQILAHLPAMRGRHLYDDLSEVYAAVEAGPPGPAVGLAYDLTWLQERFWSVLLSNRLTLVHNEAWNVCTAQAWRRRLLQRAQEQKGWRRNSRGKLKGPITAPIRKVQSWYN